MKLTRKILAIALCILMLAALCAPAMATEPGTTEEPREHEFVTYQVFKGTQAEGDTKLADIQWGDGVNAAGFVAALQREFGELFAGITVGEKDNYGRDLSAKRVAEKIADWAYDSDEAQKLARAAYANRTEVSRGTTGLPSGYYLVVDTTEGDTYVNIALLQVTSGGSVETTQKVSVPTVEKKVTDVDDSTGDVVTGQDSADYDIGDDVPFEITAKFGMIDHFEQYKAIFHDTLSAGLTYNNDAVIKLINPNGTQKTVTNLFTITSEGTALTFACDDILAENFGAMDECIIEIKYTAKLNENAVIGAGGNPNTVYLEYSHDPNVVGGGEGNTHNTPEDKVVVYTYQVVLTKVDGSGEKLAGAEFELYKKVGETYVLVEGEDVVSVSEDGTVFTFKGLDAGEYKLVETKAPAGYNKIEAIEFTISATHSSPADDPKLETLECTVDKYDGELGEEFALGAELSTGTISGNIVNVAGLIIPETGGSGTTTFYAVGSLIVLCAVVGLVAKKRMEGIA